MDNKNNFWYRLGYNAGGPLYLGLYSWLINEMKKNAHEKICFLSDGSNYLFQVFKLLKPDNISISYISSDDMKNSDITENGDKVFFHYGWEGEIQEKYDDGSLYFYYAGVLNSDNSRENIYKKHYSTFLFDFYTYFSVQDEVRAKQQLYDLFFKNKNLSRNLLTGVLDHVKENQASPVSSDHGSLIEESLREIRRIAHAPTDEELGKLSSLAGLSSDKPDSKDPMSEYHLEDELSLRNYKRWLKYCDRAEPEKKLEYRPFFSVVIPVYNTKRDQLKACIDSVLNQSYDNFELILVDDHSSWEEVAETLREYEGNSHTKLIFRDMNGHISAATNDGIDIAAGEFIVFMDCDDVIKTNALYLFAKKLNEDKEYDFIYSDEDKLTEDGKLRHAVFFKPDWSPDLFLNINYTNHLSAYRASIVKEIGGLRSEYNGSQDYDMTLRFMEHSDNTRVGHIQNVLYHWRERKESAAFTQGSKNYAIEAAGRAKQDYIERNKINAKLRYQPYLYQYQMVYEPVGEPLVSVIIPSKDHPDILVQCIESVLNFTEYENYEIIVVDNGSSEDNRKKIGDYLENSDKNKGKKTKYIYRKMNFNFSCMCNIGAEESAGDYLLFLNDDIEIFQKDWMTIMTGQAMQKHTGAVGAKLYYPKTTKIQHAGVSSRVGGPAHNFLFDEDAHMLYFGWNWWVYNCSAVTGACLMVSREKFDAAGGFDEKLPVSYNDVSLCFSLCKMGLYNVQRNDVAAYHHESLSRGNDLLDDKKFIRLVKERSAMYLKYPDFNEQDPFLNNNLKYMSECLAPRRDYDDVIPAAGLRIDEGLPEPLGSVDIVNIDDKIRISGWMGLSGGKQWEEYEAYVILQDPKGDNYLVKPIPARRDDVAETLEMPDRLYMGFEVVLSKEKIGFDLFPYKIGIYINAGESGYFKWCGSSPMALGERPTPNTLDFKKVYDLELNIESGAVTWNIESFEEGDGYHYIRGFAFRNDIDSYKYKNTLLLLGEKGDSYEADMYRTERVDIALGFPKMHYINFSGFECHIYENMLQKDEVYNLVIRTKNMFDESDYFDNPINRKVSV